MVNRLLTGTAIAAALAITSAAWAQAPNPSSPSTPTTQAAPYTSSMPSATAPGATTAPSYGQSTTTAPYGQSSATSPYAQQQMPTNAAPGTGMQTGASAAAMPPSGNQEATGATAPTRRHMARSRRPGRHATGRVASRGHRGGQMNDNVADQLNREEAGRLGSGGGTMPGGAMPNGAGQMGQAQPAPGMMQQGPRASGGGYPPAAPPAR